MIWASHLQTTSLHLHQLPVCFHERLIFVVVIVCLFRRCGSSYNITIEKWLKISEQSSNTNTWNRAEGLNLSENRRHFNFIYRISKHLVESRRAATWKWSLLSVWGREHPGFSRVTVRSGSTYPITVPGYWFMQTTAAFLKRTFWNLFLPNLKKLPRGVPCTDRQPENRFCFQLWLVQSIYK